MSVLVVDWVSGDALRRRTTLASAADGPSSPGRTKPAIGAGKEPDEALMRRYQRGDLPAFEELYQRHRMALLRFVRRLSPHVDDNEEIAQETWMAVIQGRERYRTQSRFVTYLFAIAHRRTMDRWRRRGRSAQNQADADLDSLAAPESREPDREAGTAALRADLMTAVASLPLLQQETFLLRAEGGLTLEEIAEVTGTSRETAKSRLRYALARLRGALDAWAS